jgi:membrane carboxypeptidase/penicillin-binding protein PbpC
LKPEHTGKRLKRFWRSRPLWSRLFFVAVVFFFGLFHILDFAFPFKPDIEYSKVILDKDSTIIHAYLNSDDKWRIKNGAL